jgi:hypothetical protein
VASTLFKSNASRDKVEGQKEEEEEEEEIHAD